MKRTAILSKDETRRYQLDRDWAPPGKKALFIMLNPSSADHRVDDPTIRRCMTFASEWGMTGMRIVNLYSIRSANPKDVWEHADPIGDDTCLHQNLRTAHLLGGPVVAAWGTLPRKAFPRAAEVLGLLTVRPRCFGLTMKGHPRHPLYLPRNTELETLRNLPYDR